MAKYSQEKKDYALSLMSPPNNMTVAQVSERTGVTEPTLYAWRNQARGIGRAVPGDGTMPDAWRSEDKFAVVVETMGLAQAELAEYCRKKGLHVEQIAQWRAACMQAPRVASHNFVTGCLTSRVTGGCQRLPVST